MLGLNKELSLNAAKKIHEIFRIYFWKCLVIRLPHLKCIEFRAFKSPPI